MKSSKLRSIFITLCIVAASFVLLMPNSIAKANADPEAAIQIPSLLHLGQQVKIRADENNNLCVGIRGASKNEGVSASLWTCNQNLDQTWIIRYYQFNSWDSSETIQLKNKNSGQCLGMPGESTHQGATPIQWACNNNLDQFWVYNPSYQIGGLQNLNSTMYLGVLGTVDSGATLVQWPGNGNLDQIWLVG